MVAVQEVLQVTALHTYGAHDMGASLHEPAPSQVEACVSRPLVQVAVPQALVMGGKLHLVVSAPSQAAPQVVPAPTPPQGVRVPWTAPTTAVHVPTLPVTSQA